MSAKQDFSKWFWEYTYENWVLTPQSKKILAGASAIVILSFLISKKIEKK